VANNSKTILVVDDEQDLLIEMTNWLGENGYHTLTADSGFDGIEQALKKKPDLILLDISMPKMDGYEFLIALRGTPELASVPIIMVTARTDTHHILKAQRLRVVDYVIKPFNEDELLRIIKRYIA